MAQGLIGGNVANDSENDRAEPADEVVKTTPDGAGGSETAIWDRFDARLLLVLVFVVACSLIFLESVLFHSLLFLASYIEATMAIPVALLGLAVGGLAAVWLQRKPITPAILCWLLTGLVLSFPLTYLAIMLLSSNILLFPLVLVVPFAFGSTVLSLFFSFAQSSRVYFADLVGAGIGAALAAPALEYLGTETPFFVGGAVLALSAMGFAFVTTTRPTKWPQVFAVLALVCGGASLYNYETDSLNLAYTALTHSDSSRGRVYSALKQSNRKLLFSHTSLSGRTDVVAKVKDNGGYASVTVYHDGLASDGFKFRKTPNGYRLDPRVPWGLIEDPDSLIIGTSAEGVVAAVAGMGKGEVHGIEIATGKVGVMLPEGPGFELTNDHYQYLTELSIMDARTYLQLTDKKFDHITMMNAHLGQRLSRSSAPEYLHTVEGLVAQLDHLTDRGFLNIEEVSSPYTVDDGANLKLTATIVAALKSVGATQPAQHVYVFRWGRYIQWFVKRTPWSEGELNWLDGWLDQQVHNRLPLPFVITPSLVYSPKREVRGPIAELIETGTTHRPEFNLAPATDNRPFGFDVLHGRPILVQVVWSIVLMSLVLVLLPVAFVVKRSLNVSIPQSALLYGYFGGLGIAYLLVEILLIQQLQRYVGTPAGSVVAILGGMLVFSGLGALASERLGRSLGAAIGVFGSIAGVACLMLVGLESVLDLVPIASLEGRMAFTVVLIAPLAFCMGMPFPMGLDHAKAFAGPKAGALMFAVNGGFSALASPIAILIAINVGFQMTMVVGVALYLALFGLFVVLRSRAPGVVA